MLGNFLQTTIRNILSHKLFSAINIFGLAIGMAAATLIFLFVQDELSYDQHWSNRDSVYRIEGSFHNAGREPMYYVNSAGPAKQAILNYFPEDIDTAARINNRNATIRVGETFYNERISVSDPAIIDIFDFEIIQGDMKVGMTDGSSLMINETVAKKYFGEENPIGKTIFMSLFSIKRNFTIAAVFKDLPQNTHLKISSILPLVEADYADNKWLFENWSSINNHTYFKLKTGGQVETIRNQMPALIDKNMPSRNGKKVSDVVKYSVTPLKDIHLKGKGLGEMKPRGNIMIIYALIAIAVMILTIAIINFMNLSTARASQRAREVSLRKVLGANRRQLIRQFIGETILLSILSLVISLVLVQISLPFYGDILNRQLGINLMDPTLVTAMVSMVVFIGVGGGIYPSYVISAFRPAEVLKANKSTDTGGTGLVRNILVVFQFAVSIGLMVATGVVYAQLNFFQSVDRGFKPNNMMVVEGIYRPGAEATRFTLHEQVKNIPSVVNATLAFESPGASNGNNTRIKVIGSDNEDGVLIGQVDVDFDLIDTYGLNLIAGRYYDKEHALDRIPNAKTVKKDELAQGNIVINQMATRKLGFKAPEQALGQSLRMFIGMNGDNPVYAQLSVIGVVGDAHFHTLKQIVRPEVFPLQDNYNALMVRYEGNSANVADQIKAIWSTLNPEVPFEYSLVEETLEEELTGEIRQMNIFAIFAGLAIFIGCLGLYGLASFTAERRTKEIGLRKVMGARIPAIISLLLWQFSKPVLIANFIAWPTVAWVMMNWLEKFPYRIENWTLVPLFITAGLVALLVAWGTISSHAFKVARKNPITALRYE